MIREAAVQFEEKADNLDRQLIENRRQRHPGHTVAGIDHDSVWFDGGRIDE